MGQRVKVRFDIKDEEGNFLVELIDDNGYMANRIALKPQELPQLMSELSEEYKCDIDVLRFMYSHFEAESITFENKG